MNFQLSDVLQCLGVFLLEQVEILLNVDALLLEVVVKRSGWAQCRCLKVVLAGTGWTDVDNCERLTNLVRALLCKCTFSDPQLCLELQILCF